MNAIIFDIETQNTFDEVGSRNSEDLDISVVGIFDYQTNQYMTFEENELPKLWEILKERDIMIGFNSLHFDLPLLNKYYPDDLNKIAQIDIMKAVKNSLGRRLSLNSIAEATLGTQKSGDGLDAIKWWKEGDIEKIKKILYKRCTNNKRGF